MSHVRANGITIEYDTFGKTSAPSLLLIMGLGAQMILWDEEFCAALAARGLHVIRFDNRWCRPANTCNSTRSCTCAMSSSASRRIQPGWCWS